MTVVVVKSLNRILDKHKTVDRCDEQSDFIHDHLKTCTNLSSTCYF